jgi:hypothetical protein
VPIEELGDVAGQPALGAFQSVSLSLSNASVLPSDAEWTWLTD